MLNSFANQLGALPAPIPCPSLPHTAEEPWLTGREQDILLMISLGLGNKHIARRMDLSVRTIELHRMELRRKLGTGTLDRLKAMLAVIAHLDSNRLAALLEVDIATVEQQRTSLHQLLN